MKIKKSTILGIFMYLLVFFSTTYFNYNLLKYVLILVVGMILLSDLSIRRFRKNRMLNWSVFIFCIAVVVVSFLNRNELKDRNPFLASIVFCIILLEFVLTIEKFSAMNMMRKLMKIFYGMTLIIVIVTDLLILFTNLQNSHEANYFNGTKFQVVYLHFFLIAFFFSYKGESLRGIKKSSYVNKSLFTVYIVLTALMAIKVRTVTGILGVVALLFFLWIAEKNINVLLNVKTFMIALLLSGLFVFFFDVVLSNHYVIYLVTRVFGKDITLTLRTAIYSILPDVMSSHWLMGYGYGSSYEVLMRYGYANPQNGVMEWIQQVGFVGTIPLFVWMGIAMKRPKTDHGERKTVEYAPLVALIYVFLFLATVEITLKDDFFGLILIVYGFKKEQEGRKVIDCPKST